ncbi:MAG: hypothetical protein GQF41_0805 [Candidatus Rifleibacterium amylolyticum]|nr:MAG: hypothetical protein GQF41_0805 [Candidatus Rifleibacterium amylolyticum]
MNSRSEQNLRAEELSQGSSVDNLSIQELQINLCLEELNSSDTLTRQHAISQLQNFVDNPKVVAALKARFEIEENPYCKSDLIELVKLTTVSTTALELSKSQTSQALEIIRLWNSVEIALLFDLVKHVKKLSTEDQVKVFCEIFGSAKSPAQIIPALSLSRKVMLHDEVLKRLEKLLHAKSPLMVIRVINLLTRLKPARLATHLPRLLVDKSMQVRLAAIKALHLLSQSEAIRLLNEFLFSKNENNRKSAFSALFLLPFNHTGDVVLRLIEQAELPKNLDQVISFLIYNNPDPQFFRRITISYLLHGKKLARLKNYWSLAARALIIARLVDKDEIELKTQALAEAKKFIQSHTSKDTADEVAKEEAAPSGHQNNELAQLFTVKEFSENEANRLLKICRNVTSPSEILAAIRLISTHRLTSQHFSDWLEALLDHDSTDIVCAAIASLQKINSARLLPHLPVLVFHKESTVGETAIKAFSSDYSDKFADKLKLWLKDNDARIRDVARKGLMEIDFLQARDLIFGYYRSVAKVEQLKFYASILILNPDRLTVYRLNDLAARSSGEKKQYLCQLSDEIKKELGDATNDENTSTLSAIISEASLQEQWAEILCKIKQISYNNQEITLSDLTRSKAFNFVMAGFLIITIVLFLTKFRIDNIFTGKTAPATATQKTYSYDLGEQTLPQADLAKARPWDYTLPELATPSPELNEVMTIEEHRVLRNDLREEIGTDADKVSTDFINLSPEGESLK